MNLFDFFTFLSNFDIIKSIGLNIFSIMCFSLMFIYGTMKYINYLSPVTLKKIPLILACSCTTLAVYYRSLDTWSGYIISLFTANPLNALIATFNYGVSYNIILIALIVFIYYFCRKYINWKFYAFMNMFQIFNVLLQIYCFGVVNYRLIADPELRTWAYIGILICGWIAWAYGYTKIFKPNPRDAWFAGQKP